MGLGGPGLTRVTVEVLKATEHVVQFFLTIGALEVGTRILLRSEFEVLDRDFQRAFGEGYVLLNTTLLHPEKDVNA